MQDYQIILLVLLLLAFLYIAVLIYVFSNVREFQARLKRRERALMILMNEKTDLLLGICELFRLSKVSLSPEDKKAIDALEELRFDKIGTDIVKKTSATIKDARSHIEYVIQSNNWLKNDLRISAYRETFEELDHNYRQSAAIYNSDVGGYMYWFQMPTCVLVLMMLGYRKRETIN